MVISLFAFAACSSTGESDDAASGSQSTSASSSGSSATSSAGSSSGRLSQEEIRAQNALRQTVFYFDFDIAEFKTEDRDTLTFHARDLAANPNKRVRLEGHADERGTREYNLALGFRRAQSVQEYLVARGVSGLRLKTRSYGKERPVEICSSKRCYEKNRRTVTILTQSLS